jgi:hypothetical protein
MSKDELQEIARSVDKIAAAYVAMLSRPAPRDTVIDQPAQKYVAGRWHPRDGNVYGRYTYEGTEPPPADPMLDRMDPQLRRSPPATE